MNQQCFLGWIAGAALLVASGCGLFPHVYRYKMTVEVQTPKGLRSGYAVREISYTEDLIKLPDSAGAHSTERGEAVAVNLPNGQTLFALMTTNPYETMQAGFGDDSPKTLDAAEADSRVHELKPIGNLNVSDAQSGYPLLVRFRNPADPMSLEIIDPNALETQFGADVQLRRITIQMTKEPIIFGIKRRLSKPTVVGVFGASEVINGKSVIEAIGVENFYKE